MKKSYKNNEFKISAPTWTELPDGSYPVWDIQNNFKYIFKKFYNNINEIMAEKSALELCSTHNKGKSVTDNPSIMIYVNNNS